MLKTTIESRTNQTVGRKKQMKHSHAAKYTMIISWLLFIVAISIWRAIHYYFEQQGLVTDEDWFESGLSFSIWGYIELICAVIGLTSPIVALVSTGIYLAKQFKSK